MWMPASRPGIIPLHPLGFGTILGRSFAALRHNPAVLLGVALGVQFVASFIVLLGTVGVAFLTFQRLETLQFGSDDWSTIFIGSTVVTVAVGFVLGLVAGAFQVLVQGIVVSEVASAALAEKHSLRILWRRVRPVAWRLIGYTAMVVTAVILLIALVVVLLFGVATLTPVLAVILGILIVLGSIPLALWLSTKLLLVTSVLVMEHTTIRSAIVRSWQLTRGRFWPILGIVVIISVIMGTITQLVGLPFSLLGSGLTTIITPTGDPDVSSIISLIGVSLLTQVVTLLVSCVSVVVSSTAAAIIYIDCRMRLEGLDIDLLGYIEQRDSGGDVSVDPYTPHPERPHAPRAAFVDPWLLPPGSVPTSGYPGAAQPGPGYPGQQYPGPVYPAGQPGPQTYPGQQHPGPQYPVQAYPGQQQQYPAHFPAPNAPTAGAPAPGITPAPLPVAPPAPVNPSPVAPPAPANPPPAPPTAPGAAPVDRPAPPADPDSPWS